MKHKIEELQNGKWVQSVDVIETTKDTTKNGKTVTKVSEKKVDKTVNISVETAKTLNIDAKSKGIRYVAIKEQKED